MKGFSIASLVKRGWMVLVAVVVRPWLSEVSGEKRIDSTLGGAATLHISADRTKLVVRHIAAPPQGKIYEVWLQYGKHTPRPKALFKPGRDGDASVVVPGSMYGVSHVLVTAEPAPHGTRAPTANPVITASLS